MNVAFYDPVSGFLIAHERLPVDRQYLINGAALMSEFWFAGKHCLPSQYWVGWDDSGPENYIGVFTLDGSELAQATLDHIESEAMKLTAILAKKGMH